MSDRCSVLLFDEETSCETDSAKPTAMAMPQPVPRAVNGSRARRRHEILWLGEQVIALQEILASHATTIAAPSSLGREAQSTKRWDTVAHPQRQRRKASEAERDRLRRRVKRQRYLIRSVARTVAKHQALRLALDPEGFYPRPDAVRLNTNDEFGDLSSHLPTMILQLGGLFMDSRLAVHVGRLRDVRAMNERTPNMTVETLDSCVVPFDVASTARAVWQFGYNKPRRVTNWMEDQGEDSDNSMRRTFEAVYNFPTFQGKAEGRMASWRIVEGERVVILHCLFLQNASLQIAAGKYGLRLFNWTVIGPPRNDSLRGQETCQIDTYEVAAPFVSGAAGVNLIRALEMLKGVCIEASGYGLDVERQEIENILLEDKINRSCLVSSNT